MDLPARQCARRGAAVPHRRRGGPDVQPGLRHRRQRIGPTPPGRRSRSDHHGRFQGQHHRLAVLPAPVRGNQRQDRRHHEAGHRLDRGQKVRRAQRRGLERHADRSGGLRIRRSGYPRRVHHRAAIRQELPAVGRRTDRRGAPRRDSPDTGAQAARNPDGADPGPDAEQAGGSDPVPEPGVIRQRRVRNSGRRPDLLRHRCLRIELAAGRPTGRHGAVDEHAEPLYQSGWRAGPAKPGAGHHDRAAAGQS